jgi:hypothetical protein
MEKASYFGMEENSVETSECLLLGLMMVMLLLG